MGAGRALWVLHLVAAGSLLLQSAKEVQRPELADAEQSASQLETLARQLEADAHDAEAADSEAPPGTESRDPLAGAIVGAQRVTESSPRAGSMAGALEAAGATDSVSSRGGDDSSGDASSNAVDVAASAAQADASSDASASTAAPLDHETPEPAAATIARADASPDASASTAAPLDRDGATPSHDGEGGATSTPDAAAAAAPDTASADDLGQQMAAALAEGNRKALTHHQEQQDAEPTGALAAKSVASTAVEHEASSYRASNDLDAEDPDLENPEKLAASKAIMQAAQAELHEDITTATARQADSVAADTTAEVGTDRMLSLTSNEAEARAAMDQIAEAVADGGTPAEMPPDGLSKQGPGAGGAVRAQDVRSSHLWPYDVPKTLTNYKLPSYTDKQYRKFALEVVMSGAQAFTATQKEWLMAELKRRAKEEGKKAGLIAARKAATKYSGQAYRATRKLAVGRAKNYCRRLSDKSNMSYLCALEADNLFRKLQKHKLGIWRRKAESASRLAASKAAALAAYRSTKDISWAETKPVAAKVAADHFNKEYDRYAKQWNLLQVQDLTRLDRYKQYFFDKATDLMMVQIEKQMLHAFWAVPMQVADKRMQAAANAKATQVATKRTVDYLTPKFVAAASHALPHAVRSAAQRSITEWRPGWMPKETAIMDKRFGGTKPVPFQVWKWDDKKQGVALLHRKPQ
mmetsp:Transcript_33021/g.72156  ORF Transcript_33021/g.72156 Transcript_33021/m.72156 type:complete len:695 (+) Transcript_33021:3-2087(+)